MGQISGGHVTPSESAKLRIAISTLGILKANICAVICAYERGVEELGIGWGWRSWGLRGRAASFLGW